MAHNSETPIRVDLFGAGTVGSQTVRLIVEQKDKLSVRISRPIELAGIACLDSKGTEEFPWIDQSIVTTDILSVAINLDIVIELIGDITAAREFAFAATESGTSVITVNKTLLAKYDPEIYSAAEAKGIDVCFGATVGDTIPFLRPLRESLTSDKVTSMLGIVNGATDYILDGVTTKDLQFDDALKSAQVKDCVEADPTGDIEGCDVANKVTIMATLGFHTSVTIDDVSIEGITRIITDDIAATIAEYKVIKLSIVVENGEAGVSARAYPVLIDENHPPASVYDSLNTMFAKAEVADDLMSYGRGTSGAPTASTVVGDVITEARHIAAGCTGPSIPLYKNLPKTPITASKAAFTVRFLIHDKSGVLAVIAVELIKNGVSINGMNQDLKPTMTDPGYSGEIQQLRIVIYLTDEETLCNTVEVVQALGFVTGDPSTLHVLD